MIRINAFYRSLYLIVAAAATISLPLYASGGVKIFSSRQVPQPTRLAAKVKVCGRVSELMEIEIAHVIGDAVPHTFSGSLVGNSESFDWFVSRHYALKTDLPQNKAAEALVLLELAWPQLVAIFGHEPPGMDFRRLAIIMGADRNSVEQAMIDDDMHVFTYGGITQEAYSCAFLYAGAAYQTRYILLHELTHLFQYCISGNTRGCYGFFVEGIADYFSSHVYDSLAQRLTINVLDRAPIHNHLAAGLAEWKELGRPTFSEIFENHAGSRGLDTIICAFLQSTPEYELNWRIFCERQCDTKPLASQKIFSETLLKSLYGQKEELDRHFEIWADSLTPSFELESRDFDQDGDSFVSDLPASESAPAILMTAPLGEREGEFVCDWPTDARKIVGLASNAIYAIDLDVSRLEKEETAGFQIVSTSGEIVADGGCTGGSNPQLRSEAQDGFFLFGMTPRRGMVRFCVATNRPATDVASLRPRLVASAPSAVFSEERPKRLGRGSVARRTAASRFFNSTALERIRQTRRILGVFAPVPLMIADSSLRSANEESLVTEADAENTEFWTSLASSVARCEASQDARRDALVALAGIKFSLTRHGNSGRLVSLSSSFPPAENICVKWYSGKRLLKSQYAKNNAAARTFTISSPECAANEVQVFLSMNWAGEEIALSEKIAGGIELLSWHVLGPFGLPDGLFTPAVSPPDKEPFDLEKVFRTEDGSRVCWRQTSAVGGEAVIPPLVHFAKEFGRQANNSVAYAATVVECDEEREAELVLGVTDAVSIWVNSVHVLTDFRQREWVDANVITPISLKKGRNTILLKLTHSKSVWFLSARVRFIDQYGKSAESPARRAPCQSR